MSQERTAWPTPTPPPFLDALRPRPTGSVIVAFEDGEAEGQLRILADAMARSPGPGRARPARCVECEELGALDVEGEDGALLLGDYGLAVIPRGVASRDIAQVLAAEAGVAEARPEFYLFALDVREGASDDDVARTWGVAATGAEASPLTGAGIRLAVLDTGLDAGHPDFASRAIASRGFVAGQGTHDVQGHGTHCAGTAAGPAAAFARPRYGVAPDAALYVGKVLGDDGAGREGDILAGMAWAIEQGCEVISMSLGRAAQPNEAPSLVYERMGRRALDRGSLILAAAGNDSTRRFGHVAPVGAPANSPSILAVAALEPDLDVAPFSNGGINPDGGEVDLAAPGVDVFSSVPRPRLYRTLSGTSMACPHAAGVAALLAQSDPALRGLPLWRALIDGARALDAPGRDVGAGLVRAPRGGAGV